MLAHRFESADDLPGRLPPRLLDLLADLAFARRRAAARLGLVGRGHLGARLGARASDRPAHEPCAVQRERVGLPLDQALPSRRHVGPDGRGDLDLQPSSQRDARIDAEVAQEPVARVLEDRHPVLDSVRRAHLGQRLVGPGLDDRGGCPVGEPDRRVLGERHLGGAKELAQRVVAAGVKDGPPVAADSLRDSADGITLARRINGGTHLARSGSDRRADIERSLDSPATEYHQAPPRGQRHGLRMPSRTRAAPRS